MNLTPAKDFTPLLYARAREAECFVKIGDATFKNENQPA